MDNIAPTVHRRTVIEVQKKNKHRRKRSKNGWSYSVDEQPMVESDIVVADELVDDQEDDETYSEPIPLELSPIIKAVVEYGKRTHALGALQASKDASNIASRLRAVTKLEELHEIASELEALSLKLRSDFEKAYEV